MSKHRFRLLEIEMIRHGVSLRHARRAALELECHHRELVEQALARGETPDQADQGAHQALGSDSVLIARYASQKELRSWAYRWRAGYLLAPVLGFAGAFAAVILFLIAISHWLAAELHHVINLGALSHGIDAAFGVLMLWLIPASIAMAFGALAGRQRIALGWLSAGVIVLSLCAAQMNVSLILAGGSAHGSLDAGIGFSTTNLPHELLHALALVALTLIPATWLRHRAMSGRVALE